MILGCTHYPLVRPILQRALGRGVSIVSSGQAIADAVQAELVAEGIENDTDRRGSYSFMSTGDPKAFRAVGTRFLQMPLGNRASRGARASRGRSHERAPRRTRAGRAAADQDHAGLRALGHRLAR